MCDIQETNIQIIMAAQFVYQYLSADETLCEYVHHNLECSPFFEELRNYSCCLLKSVPLSFALV